MRRSLIAVTAPPVEPITLAETKAHLRLDDDQSLSPPSHPDDELVTALIAAARQRLDGRDGILGRAIVEQQWDLRLDGFPCRIVLPLPPLRSVDQITYVDVAGATQTLSASVYQVVGLGDDGRRASIVEAYGQSWPSTRDIPEAVTVRFTCGYVPSSDSPADYRVNVPVPIRQALKMMVAHWYENREATLVGVTAAPLPLAVESLLAPYQVAIM